MIKKTFHGSTSSYILKSMRDTEYKVKRSTCRDADFLMLVQELDAELRGRYGEEQDFFDVHNKLDDATRVALVYSSGIVIGCGAFRPMRNPLAVEVKRMYVMPSYRSRGVGKAILKALEAWASEQHFQEVLLETGVKQPEAIAAYTKAGYQIIDNYGPYVDSSYSICMRKTLV